WKGPERYSVQCSPAKAEEMASIAAKTKRSTTSYNDKPEGVVSYGRYYDELEPGQRFEHWPGRTITEFDDTLFSLLSMNQQPLHLDEHYSRGTQHGRRVVVGPLVIALVIGMSQADVGGRATYTSTGPAGPSRNTTTPGSRCSQ